MVEEIKKPPLPWVEAPSVVDFAKLDFSRSGFLNYIIRYGGGATMFDAPDREANMLGVKGGPIPFRPLREYVLTTSDQGKWVKNFFDYKFFTYTTRQRGGRAGTASGFTQDLGRGVQGGGTELQGELALGASKALQCPAYYKALPKVEIVADGNVIASNDAFAAEVDGINVVIQDLTIDNITKPSAEAGSMVIRAGRMTVQFSSTSKKKEILQTIAESKLLGWMFDVKNEYRVSLSNERKEQNFIGKNAKLEKDYYEALLQKKVSFITTTIKYELTQWKPHQNRVTFSVQFADSSKNRELVTKSSSAPPKTVMDSGEDAGSDEDILKEETRFQYKSVLIAALLKQMEKNQSLFSYSFMKSKKESDNFLYRFAHTAVGSEDTSTDMGAEPSDYTSRGRGVFFLFRSLLVATIQTYFEDTTLLDGDKVGDIFFDKETYDRMYIGVDEDIVPTEVISCPWWDRNDDVRNTFETVVVDVVVFTKFMDGLMMTHPKITIDFFIDKMFNVLLPAVLKANIKTNSSSPSWVSRTKRPSFSNQSPAIFELNQQNITNPETRRVIRFLTVNNDRVAHMLNPKTYRRNMVDKLALKGSITDHGGNFKLDEKQWGANRFKQLDGTELQHTINDGHETADEAFAMLLHSNKAPTREDLKHGEKEQLKRKNILNESKQGALASQGIIRVNWYDRKDPSANINYRFVSKEQESPFQFSVLDNKHLANVKRGAAGSTPFFNNIYTVKFSVYDYLGIAPYLLKFYFPPEFFGFSKGIKAGHGIGDAFGLSGVYMVSKSTISYSLQKPMFITSVELTANQTIKLESDTPPSPAEKKKVAPKTPDSEPKLSQAVQNQIDTAEGEKEFQKDELLKLTKSIREQEVLVAKIKQLGGEMKTTKVVGGSIRQGGGSVVTVIKTKDGEEKKLIQLKNEYRATRQKIVANIEKAKKLKKDAREATRKGGAGSKKPCVNQKDC